MSKHKTKNPQRPCQGVGDFMLNYKGDEYILNGVMASAKASLLLYVAAKMTAVGLISAPLGIGLIAFAAAAIVTFVGLSIGYIGYKYNKVTSPNYGHHHHMLFGAAPGHAAAPQHQISRQPG